MPKNDFFIFFYFIEKQALFPTMGAMGVMVQSKKDNFTKAIQSVAVGKKGSRSLTNEQVCDLIEDISSQEIDPVKQAVLCTAILFKGPEPEEIPVLEKILGDQMVDTRNLAKSFFPEIDLGISNIINRLLDHKETTYEQMRQLGDFYFDIERYRSSQVDCARAISAVWLRLRYASDREYLALYKALAKKIKKSFSVRPTIDKNLIQIAEPFDGVNRSAMITPILSCFLQKSGYKTISLTGVSSGPKYGVNLKSLAESLGGNFLRSNQESLNKNEKIGYYIDLEDISEPWRYWVDLRKRFIKRPFMATLEKFINVMGASIQITSAFHEPFQEKMISLGEGIGYHGNIVIRKGREGSLAFSLSKPVVVECSVRQPDSTYKNHSFEFSPKNINSNLVSDGREEISLEQNVKLIEKYLKTNSTGDSKLDLRIYVTNLGIKKAIDWIFENSR